MFDYYFHTVPVRLKDATDLHRATYFVLESHYDGIVTMLEESNEFSIHIGLPDRPDHRHAWKFDNLVDALKRLAVLGQMYPHASRWLSAHRIDELLVGSCDAVRVSVDSVADLRDLDPRPVRKGLTMVGERIIYELRGTACLPLDLVPARRKGCAVTRSFSARITERTTLEEAVAAHATRLGEKLRREGLGTDHVTVYYHTSEHDRDAPQRSVSTTVHLPEHTSDTLTLIRAGRHGVARTWRDPEPGRVSWRYSKAGVITNDLVPLSHSPRALIGALDRERSGPLMAAMDACNARFGRGTVVPAQAGLVERRAWNTKFEMRAPRYTTQVGEIPIAHA